MSPMLRFKVYYVDVYGRQGVEVGVFKRLTLEHGIAETSRGVS